MIHDFMYNHIHAAIMGERERDVNMEEGEKEGVGGAMQPITQCLL